MPWQITQMSDVRREFVTKALQGARTEGVGLQPATVHRAAGPMGSGRCSLPKGLRSEGVEDRALQT
jgi:hypothetical protein